MAGSAAKSFQMTQMMDLVLKAAKELSKSARRQVKDFDEDLFTLELQQLLKRVACPEEPVMTPPPAPMMSSPYAALASVQPVARNSIDLLVLAHDYWSKGKHQTALEHFALAMSTPGVAELADALDGINNPEEEDQEEDEAEKPKKPTPPAASDDKNTEEADTTTDGAEEFQVDDNDEPDFDEPSRLRQTTTDFRRKQSGEAARTREVARALANKISLSGRRRDRVRASRLLEN